MAQLRFSGTHNVPAHGPGLLVANHISDEDAALVVVAANRMVHFPSLLEAPDLLRAGELVCIFPEGRPARTGTVETFSADVEPLLRACDPAAILPMYLLRNAHSGVDAAVIGSAVSRQNLSAGALRRAVVELGCEACELTKTSESTLVHRLIQQCRALWTRPAISDSSGKRYTFGELLTTAVLLRDWVRQRADERNIGIYLPSSTTAAIVNYGITLAGRTAVNLNFTAGERNCRAAAATCELQTVLTSRSFLEKASLEKASLQQWPEMVLMEDVLPGFSAAERERARLVAQGAPVEELARGIQPDDTACVLFSSGSTGVPKGIELTHWNLLENADGCEALFPITPDDCMLGVLPFFHSFGYTFALWFPVLAGFRATYHSTPTDARVVGDLAEQQSATFMLSTPTFALQYSRKIEREYFRTLRYVLVGAEKLRDSVADEFRSHFGFSLLAGYGCTELGPGVAINRPDVIDGDSVHIATRPGSVGRPLRGISIRIVHPETEIELPTGEQGLVLVKGPSRMPGYYNAPDLTATVLRDGYYVTGDVGYVDDDGFLYITDRMALFSKIGGEMVPHLRIEEVVSGLVQAFVTGVPDEQRSERLVMLFVGTASPAEVHLCLCGAGIPNLWIPKRENIYSVAAIPTMTNGKVDLQRAREVAASLIN